MASETNFEAGLLASASGITLKVLPGQLEDDDPLLDDVEDVDEFLGDEAGDQLDDEYEDELDSDTAVTDVNDADDEQGQTAAKRKRKKTSGRTSAKAKRFKNGSGLIKNGHGKDADTGSSSDSDDSDGDEDEDEDDAEEGDDDDQGEEAEGAKEEKEEEEAKEISEEMAAVSAAGQTPVKSSKRKKGSQKKKKSSKTKKSRGLRRNIRKLMKEEQLTETTKEARAEEAERLRRLMMGQQHSMEPSLGEAFLALPNPYKINDSNGRIEFNKPIIDLSSSDEDKHSEHLIKPEELEPSSLPFASPSGIDTGALDDDSDSDVKILSGDELYEQEDVADEDPERLGLHVDDRLNVAEPDGRILVNRGHPAADEDIFLAPQFQGVIKPHQIGGVRFLYDNIIESTSRFDQSNGFGCILAHSMGLGKTLQLVTFSDIFLRHTSGKRILCIVPINTIQNWLAEFNHWIPAPEDVDPNFHDITKLRPRNFRLHLLNDSLKNLEQRAKVILDWKNAGGVLLMGYELYRLMAMKTQRKKRKTKKETTGPVCIDVEEEDKEKLILDEIYKLLVNPGPDLVICDEGHRIKNSHASTSQALKAIRTKRRIVMTGYPLQNNLMEYWCMVDFVRPNYLGTRTEFSNMFERPIQNGQCLDSTPRDRRLMMHRVHVLQQQLQGFVQRRGHQVLRLSLPPKREYVVLIRMTAYQRKLYRLFMEELINHRSVSNPLKAFAVCCKIWNHPDVLYNFVRAKEEAEDLDIEWDEPSANGSKSGPSSAGASGRSGKSSPRKKATPATSGTATPMSMNQDQLMLNNPTGFINIGQGFSPFPSPIKKDEISYDWTAGCFTEYVEGLVENSHKMILFLDILEETIRVGDRILLFSQSLFTLSLLEDFLKRRLLPDSSEYWCPGVTYFRLDGSTPALERERLINAFNADQRVKLFLVSTRAGSLGINLVGANRVIVFDASWNPCHDSQAVCRVYRYGQRKISHIYRFVTDNSLEKKIYDRQVNKQGMSDRIVDESNPEARLSSRDIQRLICDDERDPEPNAWNIEEALEEIREADPVLATVIQNRSECLSAAPFTHESLLVDRKEKKLSRAEKRMALQNFEMERNAKISYTRPSYAAYYPKPKVVLGLKDVLWQNNGNSSHETSNDRFYNATSSGWPQQLPPQQQQQQQQPSFNHGGAGPSTSAALRKVLDARYASQHQNQQQQQQRMSGLQSFYAQQPSLEHPVYPPNVLPTNPPPAQQHLPAFVHAKPDQFSEYRGSGQPGSNSSGSTSPASSRFPIEALLRQKDIQVQEKTLDSDMVIPTNSPDEPVIRLNKGQQVTFIRTPKGIYLKLGEKIIKIRLPHSMMGSLAGSSGQVRRPPLLPSTVPPTSTSTAPPQVVTIESSDSETEARSEPQSQENQQPLMSNTNEAFHQES